MRDIGMILSTSRKKAGYTQQQLAEELKKRGIEISFRSISNWEKNVCEPSVTAFLNMCEILRVPDVREAYFGNNDSNPMTRLNEAGREKVLDYIKLIEGFNDGEYLKDKPAAYGQPEPKSATIVDFRERPQKIKIFSTRVSAGTGNLLDDDSYEEYSRAEFNAPENADFGVRLTGDSMTPLYQDQQIVWVHQQDTLEEGQIGIFALNGECFCKKFGMADGQRALISLNKNYAPKIIKKGDSFRTFGRVIS